MVRHFPIFLHLSGRRVVVSGAGRAASAKLRLLLKTDAAIAVFGPDPDPEILAWHREGALRHEGRRVEDGDLDGAALLWCASEDRAEDEPAAALARRRGIPVNVVDDPQASDFITPAIVDRDPVTVAIGTEGTAPVLARQIKAAFEAALPVSLGPLARIAGTFRGKCGDVPAGRVRRALWSEYFFRRGPRRFAVGGRERRARGAAFAARRGRDRDAPGRPGLVRGRGAGRPGAADAEGPQPPARGGRGGA